MIFTTINSCLFQKLLRNLTSAGAQVDAIGLHSHLKGGCYFCYVSPIWLWFLWRKGCVGLDNYQREDRPSMERVPTSNLGNRIWLEWRSLSWLRRPQSSCWNSWKFPQTHVQPRGFFSTKKNPVHLSRYVVVLRFENILLKLGPTSDFCH